MDNPAPRLVSLDALRGFDMLWILGLDRVVNALGHALGDTAVGRFLIQQVSHKKWDGFTFYDLIFPLFVFMVGVSVVFSLRRVLETGGRSKAMVRILRRGALLFALGIFYYGGISRGWMDIRWGGVLQRIAVAYTIAAALFCFCNPRTLMAVTVLVLAGYAALLRYTPIRDVNLEASRLEAAFGLPRPPSTSTPLMRTEWRREINHRASELYDGATTTVTGRYEPGRNLAAAFDFKYLPGFRYFVTWDPEGIISTVGAIATGLIGVFAGLWLQRADVLGIRKALGLIVAGIVISALGWFWGLWLPVIKAMWTPSYVLVAGGYSLLLLGAFYYVIDVRLWRGGLQPFLWIGSNAITLYLVAGLVAFDRLADRLVGGDVTAALESAVGKGGGEVLLSGVSCGLLLLLARFLYVRRIFLKV